MIKFDDLENAFQFVSSDQEDMNEAVINRKTGAIFYRSDVTGDDDFPDDVDSDDYIFIPHKNNLDLGRDLVYDFVSKHLPQKYGQVRQIFSRPGAYSQFKDLLLSIGLLEKWYQFENEETKSALVQWCKDVSLEIEE
ncbi:MAG: hypothetical protein EHM72_02610 [Calditrichaeota bacterium]|nr:MAG: hypothetical protein EHM72_02610 [Calditrichota bacterium]